MPAIAWNAWEASCLASALDCTGAVAMTIRLVKSAAASGTTITRGRIDSRCRFSKCCQSKSSSGSLALRLPLIGVRHDGEGGHVLACVSRGHDKKLGLLPSQTVSSVLRAGVGRDPMGGAPHLGSSTRVIV